MAREIVGRNVAIDFTRAERMSFRRFVDLHIDSEMEVVLENGVLKFHRGWNADPEGAVSMTPKVAGRPTHLFGDCGVSGWKRLYEPASIA